MKLEKVKTGMYYSPKLNMMIQIYIQDVNHYSCMYGGYDPQTGVFKGFYGMSNISGCVYKDHKSLEHNWKALNAEWGPITLIEEGQWATWVMQL